ncbi:adenylate/guanylate cyclase domain-containing protein [Ensifer sp. IC3342]|nr:adenylate/guanylate cyclase domain-containing protein [Ensifer sp. BRP08]MCA1447826.1 adenylate/guanylate cyclase domain-containing protein [Ensifer sp. IC3342]
MQASAEKLLKTYLGKRTGERVLAGRTKRGEGEKIHAVIWLCDLRDSTRLSESIPVEDFFRTLNEFFDCTAGAVLDHGGEILSYIGDAVLAIFAIGGTERPLREACFPEEGACSAALAAARAARSRVDALNDQREMRGEPRLNFGLALHVGDVMYGNLGVPQRMQFTVIGAAANEAARLAGMCKDLHRWVLVSSRFRRCFPGQLIPLGHHLMRGVDTPQEIFTLIDDDKASLNLEQKQAPRPGSSAGVGEIECTESDICKRPRP